MLMGDSSDFDIRPPGDDAELAAFAAILAQSLQFPDLEQYDWAGRFGVDQIRLARVGGAVAGGLAIIRMGQWFGGRSVPMVGVSAVGVAPEHRATGVASALMRSIVCEIAEEGGTLSGLYPATQPVYQRAGYERAGARVSYRILTASIDIRDRGLDVRPIAEDDHESIHDLYRTRARRTSGNIDRAEWNWRRVFEPRGQKAFGYVVGGDDGDQGYITFTQQKDDSQVYYDLHMTDFVAITPAAGRRLWTFLADHRSVGLRAIWHGSPSDPIRFLPAEQTVEVIDQFDWMTRVIDVRRALEARGYPPGVTGEVHFEVVDEVLAANEGRFVLTVEGGCGAVRLGGDGRVRAHVRGLAAMYTGFNSPSELLVSGLVDGDEKDLALAGAVFSGPAPWMPEVY